MSKSRKRTKKGYIVIMKCTVSSVKPKWRAIRVRVALVTGLLVVLAVAASISGSIASASTGDWSTFLENNGRTGFNSAETIINTTTAHYLKLHWMRTITARITSEPVEANGMIY